MSVGKIPPSISKASALNALKPKIKPSNAKRSEGIKGLAKEITGEKKIPLTELATKTASTAPIINFSAAIDTSNNDTPIIRYNPFEQINITQDTFINETNISPDLQKGITYDNLKNIKLNLDDENNPFKKALNKDCSLLDEDKLSVPKPGVEVKYEEFLDKNVRDYSSKEIKDLLTKVKSGKLKLTPQVALSLLENKNIDEADIAQINELMTSARFPGAFYEGEEYSDYLNSLRQFSPSSSSLNDYGGSTSSPICQGLGGTSGSNYNQYEVADGHQIADNAITNFDEMFDENGHPIGTEQERAIQQLKQKKVDINNEINSLSSLWGKATDDSKKATVQVENAADVLNAATERFTKAAEAYHNRNNGNKSQEEIAKITQEYNDATNALLEQRKKVKETDATREAIENASNAIQARIAQLMQYKQENEQLLNMIQNNNNNNNILNLTENGYLSQ